MEIERFFESLQTEGSKKRLQQKYQAIIQLTQQVGARNAPLNYVILSPKTPSEKTMFQVQNPSVCTVDRQKEKIGGLIVFATSNSISDKTPYVFGLTDTGEFLIFHRETLGKGDLVQFIKTAISSHIRDRGLFDGLGAAIQYAFPYSDEKTGGHRYLPKEVYDRIQFKTVEELIDEHLRPITESL